MSLLVLTAALRGRECDGLEVCHIEALSLSWDDLLPGSGGQPRIPDGIIVTCTLLQSTQPSQSQVRQIQYIAAYVLVDRLAD